MKKYLYLLAFLALASPSWAATMRMIPIDGSTESTAPSSTMCQTPTLQSGQKSAYYYANCKADASWVGGSTFTWRLVGWVPGGITTPNVHIQAMFESRTNVVGGNQALQFNFGAVVIDNSCNIGQKDYCSRLVTTIPPVSYVGTATNNSTGSRCMGSSDVGGVADGTACSADATCSGTGQICLSKVQYTTKAVTPLKLQTAFLLSTATLVDCTAAGCAGQEVVFTVQLDKANTTIERDWRFLGILVTYNQ